MRHLALVLATTACFGCVSPMLVHRAATDLSCEDSKVVIQRGFAGAFRATGCGDWIDYWCFESQVGDVFCTEERRAHDFPVTHLHPRTPTTGSELAACFGNQTCFAPLECVQGICLRPGGAGQIGGPCFVGKCNASLACVQDRCEPTNPPPEPVGAKLGACYPNETCNAGLRCVNNGCYDEATAPHDP